MSAPAYTTDLVTIDTAEAITAWAEPTDATWMLGGSAAQDVDYPYIQGSYAVLQSTTKTGIASLLCNSGGAITLPTDGAFLVWQNFYSPGPVILDVYANGGLRVMVGSSLGNFDSWDVGGADVGRNPYGGWQNHAVNPTVPYDDRVGSGAGNYQYVGAGAKLLAGIGKGYPHNIDVVRYGRCEARFSGGETANYAVLTGFVTLNDATSARWGLIQSTAGGYLWKGMISLGESNKATATRARSASNVATLTFATAHKFKVGDIITVTGLGGTGYNATAAVASVPTTTSLTYANTGSSETQTADTNGLVGCIVDFRDSNKIIFIEDTRKVTAAFNKIEVKHASSRVDLTGFSFICLSPSTAASKGRFECVEDADVNISYCIFSDMDTFIFKATSAILNSTFRRCNTITANDANFSATLFDSASVAADTSQLIWDVATDPNSDLTGCTFIKGALAHHAIELGLNSPTSLTLTNVTFTGFNASNEQNDSAIHVKRTTGTVTITITGGSTPSYKSAGALVDIVTSSRTIKAVAQLADGTKIGLARVLLRTAATASGGFPYDVTVTIVNNTTTATVAHTGHGMKTNDKVQITGASLYQNNGVFSITKITDDSYSYTMLSAPGSSPTGTIKCSFVFLEGETDNTEGTTKGEISMSRAIGANQAVVGWIRKASSNYKQGSLSGAVVTSGNLTLTGVLLPDS